MVGWIKLHRKMTEWEWYTDHNTFILFMHLLLTVNYEDTRYRGHEVPRGARVVGRLKLSEETGLSEQQLRTSINKLKSTGEITIKATNKFSVLTVCNFDKYQAMDLCEQPAKQPASQPTSNQQVTTSKEVKKEKKEISLLSKERFDLFWEKYPRKDGKKDAFNAWEKQKCFNGHFEFIMEKVELFNSYCSGKEKKFIPLPATWINGERWNDEMESQQKGEIIGGYHFE